MAAQKIQLRKLRNFGENITDTFVFIRQEFKPFIKSVLLIAGIFILIHAIMIGSFEAKEFGMLDRITKNPYGYNETNSLSVFTLQYFIILIVALLLLSIMHVITAAYMKLYNEEQQSPSFPELWNTFKKYFLKSFIFSIPVFAAHYGGLPVFAFCPELRWAWCLRLSMQLL